MTSDTYSYIRLLRDLSSLTLNVPTDRASTTSLGRDFRPKITHLAGLDVFKGYEDGIIHLQWHSTTEEHCKGR